MKNVLSRLALLVAILCVSGCKSPYIRPMPKSNVERQNYISTYNAQVVRVVDGDTLHVKDAKGQRQKIRLFGIDAPELRQRDGAASGRYLGVRIGGLPVTVVVKDVDPYDRQVAMVYDEYGQSLNEEMIRLGLAWVYRSYAKNPSWNAIEAHARVSKVGLWRRKTPIPPWQFRQRHLKNK